MSRLPRVTGREMLRALERAGFNQVRIRGSHHFMVHHRDATRWATVPIHSGQTLPLNVMRNILRTSGLSLSEILELLSS